MFKKASLLVVLLAVLGPAWSVMAGFDPALVAWWPLDEGAGTVAADGSGNGNDGTVEGGALWVSGVLGTALQFNGSNSYVNAPYIPFNSQSFTIALWINPGQTSSDQTCFGQVQSNATDTSMHFRIVAGGAVRMGFYNNDLDAPSGTVQVGNWYHLAFQYDFENRYRRIYVNGEVAAQAAATPYLGTTGNTHVGQWNGGEYFTGMIDDVQVYHKPLADGEVVKIMAGLADQSLAQNPSPADEAVDVPRDVVLSWDAGEFAATHDAYFGTSFDDVNAASRSNPRGVLLSQGQAGTSYDPPGVLDFETTYYWRIDEVNAPPDNTIYKGEVWSFTSEPFAYAIENIIATSNGPMDAVATPQRTVDGSGINAAGQASTDSTHMWLTTIPAGETLYIQYEFDRVYKLHEMLVWNYNVQFELLLGFGLKGVTVEYSEDGADWTVLGDFEFARATAASTYTANTTVEFGGAPVKFVRINVNSGWGMMGQYGLSEVRFLFIPAQAREPQPADGAAGVDVGTALSWRSGREAASHEVYLSTDPNALALAATVDSPTFAAALEFGSTYYWQVVEVNEADVTTAWPGDVWSFSTQEYALIDGFETYNDDLEAGTTIFDTWLDGWVNKTGSTVGYINSPFAEKSVVHGGSQSMPLQYNNTTSPFYSEAWREFQTAQNWTGNGADTLVLYVRGNAPAFQESADGSIIMSGIGTDIWNTTDQFRYAYKSLSGDGSMTVRVDSVVVSDAWAKAGVMIRETLEAGSKHAFVAITPTASHGASFQRRPIAGGDSANTDVADVPVPYWVKLTRTGNVFTAQRSADGVAWVDITVSPAVTVQMISSVYIGLAVTSHNASISTVAEFSNLSTTGGVTGAWQTADIGVTQPVGNATAEPMYVRIEDAAGKTATVVNADASITLRATWQEWAIPYSDLSGVNLGRVEKMIIGVGSKTSPKAGGTGTVYVDDIGFGRPAAQ